VFSLNLANSVQNPFFYGEIFKNSPPKKRSLGRVVALKSILYFEKIIIRIIKFILKIKKLPPNNIWMFIIKTS